MDKKLITKKGHFTGINENQIIEIDLGLAEHRFLGIMDLLVNPTHRRQGVASSLLNMAIE